MAAAVLTVFTGGASTEVVTQQPPTWQANPILVNLAPGAFADLGPVTFPLLAGETRNIFGNGGMEWDTVRGQLVIFPGGHSTSNRNAVMTYSAVDLTLRDEYPPTPPTDMLWSNYDTQMLPGLGGTAQIGRGAYLNDLSHVGGPYPRPASRHVGSLSQVIGDYLYLFARVEGNGPGTQQGILLGQPTAVYVMNCKAQIARYHFPTKTWDFESYAIPQTDGNEANAALYGATEIDPVTGKVVWVDSASLYTYDPATRIKIKWVAWASANLLDEAGNHLSVGTFAQYAYTGSLVYDSLRDKWYFFTLHDDVWRVNFDRANPAATTMTRLTVTGTSPAAAHPPQSEHAHHFSNVDGVIGVGPFAGVFYEFDPVAKAWSHTAIAGYTDSQYGNSHMMQYLDGVNVYVWLTDNTDPIPAQRNRWVAYRRR